MKVKLIGIFLVLGLLQSCASILDDRHQYTKIYLPGKIAGLMLGKEHRFDKSGRNMGYFYQNFDRTNPVTLVIYIYPVAGTIKGDITIENELKARYPNSSLTPLSLRDEEYVASGMYAIDINNRVFAGRETEVKDTIYLFTYQENWFVKIFASYRVDKEKSSKPVVEQFLNEFKWMKPNDFKGYDI